MAIQRVTPQEAHDLMKEGQSYLDVRTPEEFEAGHPDGAHNVPFALRNATTMQMEMNPQFIDIVVAHFDKSTPLIIGCQMGGRSARSAMMLEDAGFSDLRDMHAGWGGIRDPFGQIVETGWAESGLPVEDGSGDERSYANLAQEE